MKPAPAGPPTQATYAGLLQLVTESGAVLEGIDFRELESINVIREIVAETAELQTTYTST